MDNLWAWVGFGAFVLVMLALDLGVFHRRAREVPFREALAWTGMWVGMALLFAAGLWIWRGEQPALEFLTGYLIEESLSIDNLFVFLLIFEYFRIPPIYQHSVLFWGVLGAIVMRALLIAAGLAILTHFHFFIYIFGAFLAIAGVHMAFARKKEPDLNRNWLLGVLKKRLPIRMEYEGKKFILHHDGRRYVTPLLVALIFVEITDLIFALDSIPAILAITQDPFIVYTSNIFAILGLRSLYFALSGIIRLFEFLQYGMAAILIFVGIKMMIADHFKIPVLVSLGVIAGILAVAIIASILHPDDPPQAKG